MSRYQTQNNSCSIKITFSIPIISFDQIPPDEDDAPDLVYFSCNFPMGPFEKKRIIPANIPPQSPLGYQPNGNSKRYQPLSALRIPINEHPSHIALPPNFACHQKLYQNFYNSQFSLNLTLNKIQIKETYIPYSDSELVLVCISKTASLLKENSENSQNPIASSLFHTPLYGSCIILCVERTPKRDIPRSLVFETVISKAETPSRSQMSEMWSLKSELSDGAKYSPSQITQIQKQHKIASRKSLKRVNVKSPLSCQISNDGEEEEDVPTVSSQSTTSGKSLKNDAKNSRKAETPSNSQIQGNKNGNYSNISDNESNGSNTEMSHFLPSASQTEYQVPDIKTYDFINQRTLNINRLSETIESLVKNKSAEPKLVKNHVKDYLLSTLQWLELSKSTTSQFIQDINMLHTVNSIPVIVGTDVDLTTPHVPEDLHRRGKYKKKKHLADIEQKELRRKQNRIAQQNRRRRIAAIFKENQELKKCLNQVIVQNRKLRHLQIIENHLKAQGEESNQLIQKLSQWVQIISDDYTK